MFEQQFAFSLVVFLFTCGNFALVFFCFSNFFDQIFFLMVFSNPFIVHSRPNFSLESNIHVLLVVFCSP